MRSDGNEEEGEMVQQHVQGALLYVSLKMENPNPNPNPTLAGELLPHVYGSFPLVSSWDPSKAVILILTHFSISFL